MITEELLASQAREKLSDLEPGGKRLASAQGVGFTGEFRCCGSHSRRCSHLSKTIQTAASLEQPLLRFFLAGYAVARPRHGFEALLLKFLMAGNAFAERAILDACECVVDQLQQ
jgi:hypothetical protein